MNYLEWHHSYLGIILTALGLLIAFLGIEVLSWLIYLGAFLFVLGLYIYIDDFYQHQRQKKEPTYSSPLHNLNSYLSQKYSFVAKLNVWMNKLFGK